MNEPLVTIRTFRNSTEAGMCQGFLEENDITVFLQNEYTPYSLAIGSIVIPIELQVPECEVEEALRLLDDLEKHPVDISEDTADLVANADPDEPMLPVDHPTQNDKPPRNAAYSMLPHFIFALLGMAIGYYIVSRVTH